MGIQETKKQIAHWAQKQAARAGMHLSDRQLGIAAKFAKAATLWCASGVLWWGVGLLAGGAAMGLHILGAHIGALHVPAFLGKSSMIFFGAMAAKSVVLHYGFNWLHGQCVLQRDRRTAENMVKGARAFAPENLPAANLRFAPANAASDGFNSKALRARDIVLLIVKEPSGGISFVPRRSGPAQTARA